jgi:hypothetical protein
MFKKLTLKRETEGKQENGQETKTVTEAGTRTGAGTRKVFNPSNAGYPLLVIYNKKLFKLYLFMNFAAQLYLYFSFVNSY